jgi:hypothetical protein
MAPIPESDLEVARRIIDEMLEPATEELILRELTRLRFWTASRDIGSDLEFVFAIYVAELRRYPPDAVIHVLQGWDKKFWPSGPELAERLKRLIAPRLALRHALQRDYDPLETSPHWIPPTVDEKAAVSQLVSDLLKRQGFSDRRARARLEGWPFQNDSELFNANAMKRVYAETKSRKLLAEDDPRVQARLREMGVEPSSDPTGKKPQE